jgi:hypothetical protein
MPDLLGEYQSAAELIVQLVNLVVVVAVVAGIFVGLRLLIRRQKGNADRDQDGNS